MAAYRFCRTDDIGLLVDALNRCWAPCVPDEPLATAASFKRSIRDLQVWCSSCMVAFSGGDPVGVLIGAKRPSGTLVHRIAVHPDHRRHGHARHLLASLGSKLAILGPPRISAEVPDTLSAACGLFDASGYVQEAVLTDYVLEDEENDAGQPAHESQQVSHTGAERGGAAKPPRLDTQGFVIPATVDDLAANGLLEAGPVCWARSVETLTARKDAIAGLAIASDARIEAYILYFRRDVGPAPEAGPGVCAPTAEIVSLRSVIEDDGGARLADLISRLRAHGMKTFRFPKVHPAEISQDVLKMLGFRPAGGHLLYAARARAE
jgi:GNAT superfamily N-acetyltransferase